MNIYEQIYEVVNELINDKNNEYQITGSSYEEMITNSLDFIQMIVKLEQKFDIEFEDDVLVSDIFNSIDTLEKYIEDKIFQKSK